MKASKLVEILQKTIEKEGDFDVVDGDIQPIDEEFLGVQTDEFGETETGQFMKLGD